MALAHYSRERSFAHLEEPPIYGKAPSLRELMEYAAKHGLILKAYRMGKKEKIARYLDEPVLALVQEDGLSHMVYLRKGRFGRYILLDPARGKRRLKEAAFLNIFAGIFLKKDSFVPKPEQIPKPTFVKRGTMMILNLARSVSVLLVFLALYFVDEEGSFPLTVALFSSFALLSVFSRAFSSKKMREFDLVYLDSLYGIEPRKRKEAYLHFHRFKAGIFSREPSLWAGALEIAALLVLFSLNELWMGVAMLGLCLALVLERAALYPKLLRRGEELARLEEDFLTDSRTPGHEKVTAKELSALTYRVADLTIYRDYLFMAVEVLLALGVAFLSDSSTSLNAFFVWLMGLYLFGEECQKFFSALFGRDEFLKEEAYFLGHFAPKA